MLLCFSTPESMIHTIQKGLDHSQTCFNRKLINSRKVFYSPLQASVLIFCSLKELLSHVRRPICLYLLLMLKKASSSSRLRYSSCFILLFPHQLCFFSQVNTTKNKNKYKYKQCENLWLIKTELPHVVVQFIPPNTWGASLKINIWVLE